LRIACVLLPDFEAALETGRRPELAGRPVIVGGLPHDRKSVRSRSPEAAAHGVIEGMPLRRARGLCPDAVFLPTDEQFYRESFGRILAVLDGFSPTVEIEGLKAADRGASPGRPAPSTQNPTPGASPSPPAVYLDAEGLGLLFGPDGDLGQRIATAVEGAVGMRPRVGIGSGKFVARTAAMVAQPGSALVVGEGEERPFLAPLPVDLLPCAPETLRRSHLLGLRTVGQMAALKAGLLAEQFGPEGVKIQRLARGTDERPLVARDIPLLLQEGMEIDPPTDRADLLMAVADRLLEGLAARMQTDYLACREVQIDLAFAGGSVDTMATTLHEPASGKSPLLRAVERLLGKAVPPFPLGEAAQRAGEDLSTQLSALSTQPPSPISALRITLSGFGGRPGEQIELFRSRAGNIKRLKEAVRESEEQFGEGAIRPLSEVATERARAIPLSVKADAAGRPQALLLEGRWEGVQELCNRWRVEEEWWRRERYRDYFRLITDSGRLCLVFRDLLGDTGPGWFLERVYE